MTPEELEIAEAEAEYEYLKLKQGQGNVNVDSTSALLSDYSNPSQSIMEQLTTPESLAPSTDRKAALLQELDSIRSQEAQEKAAGVGKMLGTEALKIGGTLGATALLAPYAAPVAAGSLISRIVGYGGSAANAALGYYAGDKAAQGLDWTPDTSPSEDIRTAANNVALGAAVPSVIDMGASAFKAGANKLSSYLNKPEVVAKTFGAGKYDLDVNDPFNMAKGIDSLGKTSPQFQDVLTTPNLKDAAIKAVERKNQLGQEIKNFYEANRSVTASLDDVVASPTLGELFKAPTVPSLPPDQQKVAQNVASLVEESLLSIANANGGKLPLNDLWELRKNLDMKVPFDDPFRNILTGSYQAARTGLQEIIESKISQALSASPDEVARYLAMNKEFSQLAPIVERLGPAAGAAEAKLPIIGSGSPLSVRGVLGDMTGLTSNRFRAGTLSAANAADPNLAGVPALSILSNSLLKPKVLPRETDSILQDPDSRNTIAGKAFEMGFVAAPEQFHQMSVPMKKDIIKQISVYSPSLFATADKGYAIMDDEFLNPMEQAYEIKEGLKLPENQQLAKMGALLNNKYIQTPSQAAQPQTPNVENIEGMMDKLGMGDINAEYSVMERITPTLTQTEQMIQQMNNARLGRRFEG